MKTYEYDTGGLGNLVNRTEKYAGGEVNHDVGRLLYERTRNAGIHAVTAVAGKAFGYDKYGNMTMRGSETITYDVFNKPTRIAGASITDFYYGPYHELYKEVSGSKTTYKLAGGIYEVIVDGNTTTQKSYVDGVIMNNRVITNGSQSANDMVYLHTDHLGSVEATTNALGQFVNRMSFSAWGERQQSNWRPGNPTESFLTTNGYTGHDQLDNHNLVHMGGRVYDPALGRFLSADLFIQSPYDSQNYNRYSYVGNNPLSYVDPSGYKRSNLDPSQRDFAYAMQQAMEETTTVGNRQDYWNQRREDAARNSNNQTMFSAMDAQAFVNSLIGQGITEFTYQENGNTYKVSIDAAAGNNESLIDQYTDPHQDPLTAGSTFFAISGALVAGDKYFLGKGGKYTPILPITHEKMIVDNLGGKLRTSQSLKYGSSVLGYAGYGVSSYNYATSIKAGDYRDARKYAIDGFYGALMFVWPVGTAVGAVGLYVNNDYHSDPKNY